MCLELHDCVLLGGQQHGTTMCSPVASSPDLTYMDKPALHSFRSYVGTSCGSLPLLSSTIFGTVSISLIFFAWVVPSALPYVGSGAFCNKPISVF